MATEIMSPETAVVGLKYNARTYDGARGCSVELLWAPWVSRETAELAGNRRRNPVWIDRKEDFDDFLGLGDFDRIAGITREPGVRYGGGELDAAGVRAAVELAEARKAAKVAAEAAEVAARAARIAAGPGRPAECLGCGATYPPEQAHRIRSHGMGCDRCHD